MRGEIEHWTWAHADLQHVYAAFGEAADQSGFEHARMRASVAPHGDPPRAFVAGNRGKGPAERISVRFVERVADDPANVIFAQNGGVEGVITHGAALSLRAQRSNPGKEVHTKARKPRSTRRSWQSSCPSCVRVKQIP